MAGYQAAEIVLYQATWYHIWRDHNLHEKQFCQSEDEDCYIFRNKFIFMVKGEGPCSTNGGEEERL
jgi:hypothetical protein